MKRFASLFRRELSSYFATPLAYVFIVIFLFLTGIFTFDLGGFYDRGQADLRPFFSFLPWLFLFLVPAISMRLWAEERKSGSIEILLTLPVSLFTAVLGKYAAAWAFIGISLLCTLPLWLTVNYLGDPDNGVILAGYFASFIMAGGYLAIGSAISAMTKNQVIAFVVTVVVCFLFNLSGMPVVLDFFSGWTPHFLVDLIASFSFLTHFNSIVEGVIDFRDLIYFGSLIALWLVINSLIIEARKAA